MDVRQRPDQESEELTIVLVGDFNPAIFQPSWFALEGLVRPSEAEKARVEVIHPDIASFSLEWLTVQVTRDRFQAGTRSIAFAPHLQDLVAGTFTKLRHTPTRQMGMNLVRRFRFPSNEEWHNFGHFLAPKSPWKGLLEVPGMRSIQVQGIRPDGAPGYLLVMVDPGSGGIVSLQVNDHFERPGKSDQIATATMYFVERIQNEFPVSLKRSEKIIEGLIDNFLKSQRFDDGTS